VYQAASGERYYLEKSYKPDAEGQAAVIVKAENPGQAGNLAPGEKLSIISAIPAGIDSEAVVSGEGIIGGYDAESDEEYPARVPAALRNPSRYGKKGDFALWAADASAEVSAARDFFNFGVFGSVLVQVINGNQIDGVYPVDNLTEVRSYINTVSPPVLFEVRTPAILPLNPVAALPINENSRTNRKIAEDRMKTYMRLVAKPGAQVTAGALRLAVIDGVTITDAAVMPGGSSAGIATTTILEYPYIGEVIWE
jgi:uncharacterized phage protein gp47/JayE